MTQMVSIVKSLSLKVSKWFSSQTCPVGFARVLLQSPPTEDSFLSGSLTPKEQAGSCGGAGAERMTQCLYLRRSPDIRVAKQLLFDRLSSGYLYRLLFSCCILSKKQAGQNSIEQSGGRTGLKSWSSACSIMI